MEPRALPTLSPRIAEFHGRIDRSLFRSFALPIFDLAREYESDYLTCFENRLDLLQRAFPEKPWPDWPALGFINLNKAILKEEMFFRETGKYSAASHDLQRVSNDVYDNEGVMDGYYLVGLYCTYFL